MSDTRKYRKFSAQQKAELVLASLRGPKTIAQLCREHDISETLLRRWREQFLACPEPPRLPRIPDASAIITVAGRDTLTRKQSVGRKSQRPRIGRLIAPA